MQLTGKNGKEMTTSVETENIARKLNQGKTKYMIVEWNSTSKQKITCLRVENFKYLGVTLNKDNNQQTDLQERIKYANKTYFILKNFSTIKIYLKN
jgi:hypothetical protein